MLFLTLAEIECKKCKAIACLEVEIDIGGSKKVSEIMHPLNEKCLELQLQIIEESSLQFNEMSENYISQIKLFFLVKFAQEHFESCQFFWRIKCNTFSI